MHGDVAIVREVALLYWDSCWYYLQSFLRMIKNYDPDISCYEPNVHHILSIYLMYKLRQEYND